MSAFRCVDCDDLVGRGGCKYHDGQPQEVESVEAWELIGSEGSYRLPGGRATYDAVQFDIERSRGDRPRLSRLESRLGGLHQVDRWIDWDQQIEVLEYFG